MDKLHIFAPPPGAQISNWRKTKHLKVPTTLPERINPHSAAGKSRKRSSKSQDEDQQEDNDAPNTAESQEDFQPRKPNKLDIATNTLTSLTPPLYHIPNIRATRKTSQAQERHIDVMNAVLHTCLLDGDFERASRAFGLLLRAGSMGPRFLKDRVVSGIGAEVIMRRDNSYRDEDGGASKIDKVPDGDDEDEEEPQNDTSSMPEVAITPSTIRLVRSYLETLSIYFPLRSRLALKEQMNFYPSFFTLWIYQVQLAAQQSSGPPEDIRSNTLRSALEIENELDARVATPPSDKDPELLELRGFVGLWLADLVESDGERKPSPERQKYLDEADEWFGKAKMLVEREQGRVDDSEGT
jgi:hypothetical protein